MWHRGRHPPAAALVGKDDESGATRADVEAAFPGWKITDVEVADAEPDPIAQRLKFDEHWYRLRRE